MNELDEIRTLFLSDDVDEETRKENEAVILDWERGLRESRAYQSWVSHEITKQIISKAREEYVQHAYRLANDRSLSDEQRRSLWAAQDAMRWIISLGSRNGKEEIQNITKEIKQALRSSTTQ